MIQVLASNSRTGNRQRRSQNWRGKKRRLVEIREHHMASKSLGREGADRGLPSHCAMIGRAEPAPEGA